MSSLFSSNKSSIKKESKAVNTISSPKKQTSVSNGNAPNGRRSKGRRSKGKGKKSGKKSLKKLCAKPDWESIMDTKHRERKERMKKKCADLKNKSSTSKTSKTNSRTKSGTISS